MRKKTIYAVLMTVLVTSFTGCGQKEDTNAVDVVVSEAETQDPDLTAEAQAAVDTLLPLWSFAQQILQKFSAAKPKAV